jgi:nitric oxide reductase large subunit
MGYQLGRLVGMLLVPLLLLGVIGFVQYVRTGDREQALRTAVSWWAIVLAVGCFFLGVVAQAVQRLP